MELLIGSALALLFGPVLLTVIGPRARLIAGLDGFVLVTVLGLVFFNIIPPAIQAGGTPALVATLLGLAFPILVERLASESIRQSTIKPAMLTLATLALGVHAMMDGAALIDHSGHAGHHGHHEDGSLALGVILHRLPLGLTLWWMVNSKLGLKAAFTTLGGLIGATCLGYFAGDEIIHSFSNDNLSIFQALMGGAILHIAFDSPPTPVSQTSKRYRLLNRFGLLGAFVGLAVLWGLTLHHPLTRSLEGELNVGETFWTLTRQASPALVIAFFGAGLLHAFIKPTWLKLLHSGNSLSQAVRGSIVGIPLPICSCGVLPFYQSLDSKRCSARCRNRFLIATPEIGIDAILISLPLLGPELTVTRVVVAALIAILAGWLLSRFFQSDTPIEHQSHPEESAEPSPPLRAKLREAMRFGFSEYVDEILPWVFVGICVGTIAEPFMETAAFDGIHDALEVPFAALIGIPIYVCASGATPLGAVLLHKGMSAGALVAFLMTGPATNISTFGVIRSLHSPLAARAFAVGVFALAVISGWAVNLILPPSDTTEIHHWATEHSSWWEEASMIIVAGLLLGCLWRMGPRGFIASIIPGMRANVGSDATCAHEHHGHDHGHHHHDHGHHHHDHGHHHHDHGHHHHDHGHHHHDHGHHHHDHGHRHDDDEHKH